MLKKNLATVGLAALLAVAPAFAQGPLKAKIPFDFTVNSTQMSAGEYSVKFDTPVVVRLVREDHKASCVVLTIPVQAKVTPQKGKFIFNKYGDAYFLSEVWRPGYDQGRQLFKSKAELEVARNAATVRHASVPAASPEQASQVQSAGRSGRQ